MPDNLTLWGRIGVAPERFAELKVELLWGPRAKAASLPRILGGGLAIGDRVHLGECRVADGVRWKWLAIGAERPAWEPGDQLLASETAHVVALEAARRVCLRPSLLTQRLPLVESGPFVDEHHHTPSRWPGCLAVEVPRTVAWQHRKAARSMWDRL